MHELHLSVMSAEAADGSLTLPTVTRGPRRDTGLRARQEFARVLRRAGYPDEFCNEVLSQLGDPIDLRRDQRILARYGLSPERLMDRLGGSP
jgi:hypothetical protein